ncbi:type II toxin-antitoxin system RelE/ParE family toxin [Paraburkholderia sp. J67]|uniref:type II toxin-antitoxin system RelE/ParE family toxin n=1 Tax=Paraburkholderia sp. J67 TaxID=2805435 RepID=UPI002ABDF0C5|nr:type II toxin-antitoxin system RelE/ParE family toxin [Paraburkholderia sp. J67]
MRNHSLASAQLEPVLSVHFFCTESGNEPVRQWLRELDAAERRAIGEEIKTVQIGWPLGMPLVRKLARDLWEVRVRLPLRIARVIFTIEGGAMVLLHGFIKKSQATPQEDMALAKERLRALMNS